MCGSLTEKYTVSSQPTESSYDSSFAKAWIILLVCTRGLDYLGLFVAGAFQLPEVPILLGTLVTSFFLVHWLERDYWLSRLFGFRTHPEGSPLLSAVLLWSIGLIWVLIKGVGLYLAPATKLALVGATPEQGLSGDGQPANKKPEHCPATRPARSLRRSCSSSYWCCC